MSIPLTHRLSSIKSRMHWNGRWTLSLQFCEEEDITTNQERLDPSLPRGSSFDVGRLNWPHRSVIALVRRLILSRGLFNTLCIASLNFRIFRWLPTTEGLPNNHSTPVRWHFIIHGVIPQTATDRLRTAITRSQIINASANEEEKLAIGASAVFCVFPTWMTSYLPTRVDILHNAIIRILR